MRAILQFIRGEQIFSYNTRMMKQGINRVLLWTLLGFIGLVSALLWINARHEIHLIALNGLSKLYVFAGKKNVVVWQASPGEFITAAQYLHSNAIAQAVSRSEILLAEKLKQILMTGGSLYTALVAFLIGFFLKHGKKYSHDHYVSGTRLAKNLQETKRSLRKSKRGLSDIQLLKKLPMPKFSEKQGILYHGSTGAGKTQAIMQLLDQIRKVGDPAIIYDKECTIKPYFFNSAIDVELNPVSSFCENWDLWEECENPLELGNLATYLIPKSVQGSDPFWVDAARTILTSTAWQIKSREDKNAVLLLQLLLTTSLDEMRELLQGTESENLVSKEIEKTAISIKSVLATYTKSLRFLEGLAREGKEKFSIKKWIASTEDKANYNKGWLFITSRSKVHREIKPLISLWLGLAMQGVQSLKPNKNRRIWIIMDELASLHRLEMLSDTVADIRKFGGCVAVGIQSIAQLDFLYGPHESSAIADLLNTSVYFRSPKAKVAKWVSEDLGEQVINVVKESQSYGPDSIRDGNTVGMQRTIRKTVESGEIMTLEDLECYIRLVGNHPITRVKNQYIERPPLCEPLIERTINFDKLEKINKVAVGIQNHSNVSADVRKIQRFEEQANTILEKGLHQNQSGEEAVQKIELHESPTVHIKDFE